MASGMDEALTHAGPVLSGNRCVTEVSVVDVWLLGFKYGSVFMLTK